MIWRAKPLRDNALAAELARVLENDRAIAVVVRIQRDAVASGAALPPRRACGLRSASAAYPRRQA
jgi:hypothetical protein